MSIVFIDGKFISVAKNGCPRCFGSGLAMTQPIYGSAQIMMGVVFCDCITIKGPTCDSISAAEGKK